jgi:hypothetical protein
MMGAGNCGLCSGTSSLGGNMGMVRLAVGRYGLSTIHYIKQSRQLDNRYRFDKLWETTWTRAKRWTDVPSA